MSSKARRKIFTVVNSTLALVLTLGSPIFIEKARAEKAGAERSAKAEVAEFNKATIAGAELSAQRFAKLQKDALPPHPVFPTAPESCNVANAAQIFVTAMTQTLRPTYDGNSPWRVDPTSYINESRNTFFKVNFETRASDPSKIIKAGIEFRSLCDLNTNSDLGTSSLIASGSQVTAGKSISSEYLDIPLRDFNLQGGVTYPLVRLRGFDNFEGKTMLVNVEIYSRQSPTDLVTDPETGAINKNVKLMDWFFAFKP